MNIETHLLASWIIGAHTTDSSRDCRLVALAGILPDLDGLGIIVDGAVRAFGHEKSFLYEHYHHFLLHGICGGVILAGTLSCFARKELRVGLLALAVFHLHLLCDLVGSRGPDPVDLWPIFYLGPFDKDPMWLWKGQWPLDGWFNRLLTLMLFAWALRLAVQRGYSFVSVFSPKLDHTFVAVLRKWRGELSGKVGRVFLSAKE